MLLDSASTTVKICDFGLAIIAPNGAFDWYGHAGTAGYMSPEVLRREKYGKPVDMWAIGAILFFLLSGDQAFWHEDTEELRNLTRRAEYTFGSSWDSVSIEAKQLVELAFELDPQRRISPEKALRNSWIKQFDN